MSQTMITPAVLDCGHAPTPRNSATPGWFGAPGFATADTGHTMCYPCADAHERAAMRTATCVVAYISGDASEVTTWTGGTLAIVDPHDRRQRGQRQYTPSGGYWTRHVWRATDPHGGRWYGINDGPGRAVRLRRVRACAWQVDNGTGRGSRYCHRSPTHDDGNRGGALCPRHARDAVQSSARTVVPISADRPLG